MSKPPLNNATKNLSWLTVGPEAAAFLARLHHEAFADTSRDLWSENDFAQILALPTTLALIAVLASACPNETGENQSSPAGFAVFSQVLDEGEILTLGVVPAQRQTGIGHGLVQAILERAAMVGAARLFLEVREDNLPALRLYKRHGFILAGRRKNYYQRNDGQPVDAIIMEKSVSAEKL